VNQRPITRQISNEVFLSIRDSGLIQKMERSVLDAIFVHHPIPLTSGEVASYMGAKHSSVSPRFAPLNEKGVIHIADVRKCSTTGRTASAWALTGAKAQKVTKKTHKKKLSEALQAYMQNDPWGCYCHEGRGQCLRCLAETALRNE